MERAETTTKQIRILLVEDSEDDADLLIHHLRKAGLKATSRRVETASEMQVALREPWDIVIADQKLNGFTGQEALELIKRDGLEIPFLLVSGVVAEEAGAAFMKAGAHDCVMKNRLARLVPAIERALREADLRKQRNLTAAALEKSEERYQRLVEVCPDCLLMVRDGSVVFANQAGLPLFGATKTEELIGARLLDLFHPGSHGSLQIVIERAFAGDKPPVLIDHRIVRRDGSLREVEIAAASFQDPQSALVQLVIRDVSDRRRLEREVLRISEHEQRRLGQDLHDGVCQKLVALKFRIAALEDKLRAKATIELKDTGVLSKILELAVDEAHGLAYGLCSVAMDRKGIISALHDLAKTTQTVFGIECQVRTRGTISWANSQMDTQLYRIAQESISNAVKHGKASQIAVSLAISAQGARLSISDNGIGFSPRKDNEGMGIQIMHYRAQRIGAKLLIEPRLPSGTRIVCECPTAAASAAVAS